MDDRPLHNVDLRIDSELYISDPDRDVLLMLKSVQKKGLWLSFLASDLQI